MLVVEVLEGISEVVGLIKDSLDIVSGQQSKKKTEQEKQEQERKAAEEKIKRSLDEAQPKFYVSYNGAKTRDDDNSPEHYPQPLYIYNTNRSELRITNVRLVFFNDSKERVKCTFCQPPECENGYRVLLNSGADDTVFIDAGSSYTFIVNTSETYCNFDVRLVYGSNESNEKYYMCVIHLDTNPKNAFLQQIPKPTYL